MAIKPKPKKVIVTRPRATGKSTASPTARIVRPDGQLASEEPLIQMRPYAVEPFWNDDLRTAWWVWARQKGKSFTAAAKALRRMMSIPGLLSVFVSASIRLGQEFIRKEAQIWLDVTSKFRRLIEEQGQFRIYTSADDDKGKLLDIDAVADQFEHQKLETKIRHDQDDLQSIDRGGAESGHGGRLDG